MKAIFDLAIMSKTGSGRSTVRKITDLPFAPFVGMKIEDSAWKDTKPVISVCLSIDEDGQHLYIWLGKHEADSEEDFKELLRMYSGHGWKQPTDRD